MALDAFSSGINMMQQQMRQQQMMQMMGGGFGFPSPGGIGGGFFNPNLGANPTGYQGNIVDAQVGGPSWKSPFGAFGQQGTEGYALDLNRNGRYDRGRDGVLVFDINRDGKYEKRDVQYTNNMMKAATGNFDFDNDGKVSRGERMQGAFLRQKFQQLDRNRDGQLSQQEMNAGGGRVWVDSSRGGGISNNELHSVNNIPNGGIGGRRNQEVDFVNPFTRTSHTSPSGGFPNWQSPPWGGNGGGFGGGFPNWQSPPWGGNGGFGGGYYGGGY